MTVFELPCIELLPRLPHSASYRERRSLGEPEVETGEGYSWLFVLCHLRLA